MLLLFLKIDARIDVNALKIFLLTLTLSIFFAVDADAVDLFRGRAHQCKQN